MLIKKSKNKNSKKNKQKKLKNNQKIKKIGLSIKYLTLLQICQMIHFLVNIEVNKRMIQTSKSLLKEPNNTEFKNFYFQQDILKMQKYL